MLLHFLLRFYSLSSRYFLFGFGYVSWKSERSAPELRDIFFLTLPTQDFEGPCFTFDNCV
ncbi:hypothetical protein KC19_11G109100 [Ceratodon purpureus]|uniref:Uncharacterized protein n=1 Tax=Ceratodon purpureus TaxID=3225 RepID=A0A8T0GDT7_CERPU|nr:hypothetical protein KC19_11G109100 [Ceratodon purpureus]